MEGFVGIAFLGFLLMLVVIGQLVVTLMIQYLGTTSTVILLVAVAVVLVVYLRMRYLKNRKTWDACENYIYYCAREGRLTPETETAMLEFISLLRNEFPNIARPDMYNREWEFKYYSIKQRGEKSLYIKFDHYVDCPVRIWWSTVLSKGLGSYDGDHDVIALDNTSIKDNPEVLKVIKKYLNKK